MAAGDRILLSGDIGRHGIAIMSLREGLHFERAPESDCAPLAGLVSALCALGDDLHCLRDLTRGGLAAARSRSPITGSGNGPGRAGHSGQSPSDRPCELLGLDPLYVANEGRLVAFVAPDAAEKALAIMRSHPATCGPALIGRVTGQHPREVELRNAFGSGRLLDLPAGEQMPRIC